jgi:hypothetical protein
MSWNLSSSRAAEARRMASKPRKARRSNASVIEMVARLMPAVYTSGAPVREIDGPPGSSDLLFSVALCPAWKVSIAEVRLPDPDLPGKNCPMKSGNHSLPPGKALRLGFRKTRQTRLDDTKEE